MTSFVEVRVKGDARALIESNSIAGIITSPAMRWDQSATPDKPMAVILRGGETFEVYGESPGELLFRAAKTRKLVRDHGWDIKVDLIDQPDVTLGGDHGDDFAIPTSV